MRRYLPSLYCQRKVGHRDVDHAVVDLVGELHVRVRAGIEREGIVKQYVKFEEGVIEEGLRRHGEGNLRQA